MCVHLVCRYYANPDAPIISGGEEYVGLQAGQLAGETREALGLGPLDPPPWLDKMRQLGYPPMYKYSCLPPLTPPPSAP